MHVSNRATPQFSKLHLSLWGEAPGALGITSWDPWFPQACLCLPRREGSNTQLSPPLPDVCKREKVRAWNFLGHGWRGAAKTVAGGRKNFHPPSSLPPSLPSFLSSLPSPFTLSLLTHSAAQSLPADPVHEEKLRLCQVLQSIRGERIPCWRSRSE